jgi:uncharacterized protein (TIGR00290 family)
MSIERGRRRIVVNTHNKAKAWVAWSSGKDSFWALHVARGLGTVDVVGLLTTVAETDLRIPMHGVREEILVAQAASLGLPLHRVRIPIPCSDGAYQTLMAEAMRQAKGEGISHVIFGDLLLDDLRAYRERQLRAAEMEACFPLWGRDTTALAREMIANGLRAAITCVDSARVDPDLAGHAFDLDLLARLPAGVDPCGENGEFHTVVWDGPGFAQPLQVSIGDTVERDGYLYTDVMLARERALSPGE